MAVSSQEGEACISLYLVFVYLFVEEAETQTVGSRDLILALYVKNRGSGSLTNGIMNSPVKCFLS